MSLQGIPRPREASGATFSDRTSLNRPSPRRAGICLSTDETFFLSGQTRHCRDPETSAMSAVAEPTPTASDESAAPWLDSSGQFRWGSDTHSADEALMEAMDSGLPVADRPHHGCYSRGPHPWPTCSWRSLGNARSPGRKKHNRGTGTSDYGTLGKRCDRLERSLR